MFAKSDRQTHRLTDNSVYIVAYYKCRSTLKTFDISMLYIYFAFSSCFFVKNKNAESFHLTMQTFQLK